MADEEVNLRDLNAEDLDWLCTYHDGTYYEDNAASNDPFEDSCLDLSSITSLHDSKEVGTDVCGLKQHIRESGGVDFDDYDDDNDDDDDDDDDVEVTIGNIRTGTKARRLLESSAWESQGTEHSNQSSHSGSPVSLNIKTQSGVNAGAAGKQKKGVDLDALGNISGVPVLDVILNSLEEKPWRKPGADPADFFNYGFTEETWTTYCEKQRRLRLGLSHAAAAAADAAADTSLACATAHSRHLNNGVANHVEHCHEVHFDDPVAQAALLSQSCGGGGVCGGGGGGSSMSGRYGSADELAHVDGDICEDSAVQTHTHMFPDGLKQIVQQLRHDVNKNAAHFFPLNVAHQQTFPAFKPTFLPPPFTVDVVQAMQQAAHPPAFPGISTPNVFAVLGATEGFPSYDGAMPHANDYNPLGMSYAPSPGQLPLGWAAMLRSSSAAAAAAMWDQYVQRCVCDAALSGQLGDLVPTACCNGGHGAHEAAAAGGLREVAGGRETEALRHEQHQQQHQQQEETPGSERAWEKQSHDRDDRTDGRCRNFRGRRQECGDEMTSAGHRRHRHHRLRYRDELSGSEENSLC